jgi:hypothetical protein
MGIRAKYKQLCAICRKNHALIVSRNQFPICTSCSMKQISQPIENEKFRKLFDIDQKLYEESSFLRSIKSNYVRFKSLSEKQIETFKKVADELANLKPKRAEKAAIKAKKPKTGSEKKR